MRIKKPNQIDTDFKAATIAAEIIENEMVITGDVIILPKGPEKRAYDKEIAGITVDKKSEGKKQETTIWVNRDGFYDMLPEGLFHRPPASSVMITEEDMIKDIKARREEEKQTRRFFAPFEAELNYFRTLVELYENRLDKKNEYDELINIFLKEWQEFECFTKKQMLILIHVLPVIHEQRNNINFVSSIINMMFNVPLSLHYKTVYPKQKNDTTVNGGTALGAGTLGVNFIAGQVIEAERKLIMNIGPVSATRMLEFLPGTSAAKAIDVLLSYFIPLGTGVQFNLLADPASQKLVIGEEGANATLGYTTYLG
ncbi:type VI secretion system baseplate subunit TssG [Mucilaginibacter rubeus]|uniref:Type VI secretion system baseplate subunit TssG n=1 Tax=Mucilaginibacter rubeus TaxID=2027860 RepID=A0AAE6MJ81_9SPHI|nr:MULTISPECIES: type VI secretion system baseplate subunit TssG [Mucilaginibacter]QEM05331.1 type VI secretion system baseplate subunit TssG [Mucilaginibacter rubeus]QEM17920.1 type VI secretion system baseplate subunit TssG [Mucilaginibacter gossypii]QTE45546.1 type VI secretion system baseplate subunit TssG [Mucilaginibacter rubeus]QTE52143.1 type VI secretion system baseplate subunit TssG [Mucilaginibacter rubeus]QTE57231.1 type VI secretion system baseplate subunit TssG [Mucilaginibacter 